MITSYLGICIAGDGAVSAMVPVVMAAVVSVTVVGMARQMVVSPELVGR